MAGRRNPERHQFVFVGLCGCPHAVVEGEPRMTEASAFNSVYPTAKDRSRAITAGIRAIHITHDEYTRTWYPKVRAGCPHQ